MLVFGAVTAEFRQNNETPKTPLPSFFPTDIQGILGRFLLQCLTLKIPVFKYYEIISIDIDSKYIYYVQAFQ